MFSELPNTAYPSKLKAVQIFKQHFKMKYILNVVSARNFILNVCIITHVYVLEQKKKAICKYKDNFYKYFGIFLCVPSLKKNKIDVGKKKQEDEVEVEEGGGGAGGTKLREPTCETEKQKKQQHFRIYTNIKYHALLNAKR